MIKKEAKRMRKNKEKLKKKECKKKKKEYLLQFLPPVATVLNS